MSEETIPDGRFPGDMKARILWDPMDPKPFVVDVMVWRRRYYADEPYEWFRSQECPSDFAGHLGGFPGVKHFRKQGDAVKHYGQAVAEAAERAAWLALKESRNSACQTVITSNREDPAEALL